MDLLDHMTTFVRIVEAGSLSAAARGLRRSLPAVSRQLQALEAELGAPLLVRSTRRMSLTDAGRRWHAESVRWLRELDAVRAELRDPDEIRGPLVVSASVSLGLGLLVPRLPALAARHPELVMELRLEDRAVDIVAEGVDLAIRAGLAPPDSTAYVAHPLTTFPRVLVASPAYLAARGSPRSPEQLEQHAGLVQLSAAGTTVAWRLSRAEVSTDVSIGARLRANTPIALVELACAGLGVALLPDWMVQPAVAAGQLVRVLPEWSGPPAAAWAVHRVEQRGSARIRAFIEALRTPRLDAPADTATHRPARSRVGRRRGAAAGRGA